MVKPRKYDYTLLIALLLLMIIGLVLLYSTSSYNGEVKFQDACYYLKKQVFAVSLGIVAMYVTANMDYHRLEKFAVPAYLIAIGLSTAVLFIGDEYNGSKRWLSLGPFSFQPSEFAKIAVILFLAHVVTKNVKKMGSVGMIFKVIILILPIVALVGASNLSTAIIILGIGVVLVFVASPKYAQFLLMGLLGTGFMTVFLALESYRLERLAIWRNPEKYEKGYQTLQGLYAIGSGGFFGKGLGNSAQKMIIPEVQNDMILSVICEELGVFGAIVILALFGMLLYRLMFIARNAPDLYGSLVVSGIFSHIALQVILNVAVVTNTIPNTGVILPFISYGGTSILFLMAEMGIALGVSSKIKFEM